MIIASIHISGGIRTHDQRITSACLTYSLILLFMDISEISRDLFGRKCVLLRDIFRPHNNLGRKLCGRKLTLRTIDDN